MNYMKVKTLNNGLKVIFDQRHTESVTVEVAVKVGSNHENKSIAGISHFLEHLVFCGTKKRKDAKEIANEVEKLGGELNAATGNDITYYYVKLPKKHLSVALDILSDILLNPLFNETDIKNERKVLLDEIKMVNDDPRNYQWVLFQRACFGGVVGNPVYGSIKTIKSITKKDIVDFYSKYYVPNNFYISIVGGCDVPFDIVENYFGDAKRKEVEYPPVVVKPKKNNEIIEVKDILQSYFVFGYPTVQRGHKDSYAIEVVKGILGRGQSGILFDEIRNKRGLAYEVGVHIEQGEVYGFFAAYVGTDKKNVEEIRKLLLKEFNKLLSVSEQEVNESKTFLNGSFLINMEDTAKSASFITSWNIIGKAELSEKYIENIEKVNVEDIKRVIGTYFINPISIILQPKQS